MTYNKQSTRYYSSRQEKRIAKDIKGKTTPNSGATCWQKSDIMSDKFAIECKTAMKEKQSFSIPKKWLQAMPEEAFAMGKDYWALAFDYGDGNEYYVIDKKLFKQIKDILESED